MTAPSLSAVHGRSVRLASFWHAVADQLSTPETLLILNGGRVYRVSEDYGRDERSDNQPWGRQVIVPVETLWPTVDLDASYRGVAWLVRSEMREVSAPSYDVAIPLERLQQIAYTQLNNWRPDPAAAGLLARVPVWRQRPPQAMPEWDNDRSLWWMSSEFRTEATRLA